jgi:hypothetical protein
MLDLIADGFELRDFHLDCDRAKNSEPDRTG